jgi:hypothetical protein
MRANNSPLWACSPDQSSVDVGSPKNIWPFAKPKFIEPLEYQ